MAIKISTPQELDNIRNNLNADYELANDINLSGWNWTPINGFEGNFDGKGFKILNLTINKSSGIYAGLFATAYYGTIQNVGLENVSINALNTRFVGALVGSTAYTTIKNCYVDRGSITAQDESGGLIGKILDCNVQDCYTNNINLNLNTSYYGGGFVGSADGKSILKNCYANTYVSYWTSSQWDGISGFVGFVRNDNVKFHNCYWNKQTSGQSNLPKMDYPPINTVNGVTGLTTEQMQQQSSYTGWDFDTVWGIDSDYPYLQIFSVPSTQPKTETITINSYSLPLQSNVTKNIKSIKNTTSQIKFIYSRSNRKVSTKRNISSYTLPIGANVQKYHRTVKSMTYNLNTYVSPINSQITSNKRTQKQLNSYTSQIQTFVDLLIPYNTFTPNAYLNVIEGVSRAYSKQNLSNVYYVVNPSKVEVIK